MNAEETKRWKAKQLRYKKPIVRDLNLDKIQEDLWNIMEECENIRWYTDSDDGNDSLINALDGDEDEAYEFKMKRSAVSCLLNLQKRLTGRRQRLQLKM